MQLNFEFVFLKEDIHRFISSTELFLSDIRGLRYTGLKKVNFFVGHPVPIMEKYNKLGELHGVVVQLKFICGPELHRLFAIEGENYLFHIPS